MSDFFGKLKSGAEKVAFEAEKMNRLNRAKGDLEKIKNQIQSQYLKLGEYYYNQHSTIGVTGPAYDEICQAIMDLVHQVKSKNDDIQRITAETYSHQGTQPPAQPVSTPAQAPFTPAPSAPEHIATSTKFCPNCGKEMSVEIKFCPDCGTKM